MTFSLVARCETTRKFGVAISSSSPAVSARCAFARAGVGAVATQNITDPSLGPALLDCMASGQTASAAMETMCKTTKHIEYRQLLAVDAQGSTAIHSGNQSLGIWNQAHAKNVAAGGNLLANPSVPHRMVEAFSQASGHLGDRLLAAMFAGLDEGGEEGPVHSAGLLIVETLSWPIAELRCDWSETSPIECVARAWEVYKPQIEAYVQRAIDPSVAPRYGVPGDE